MLIISMILIKHYAAFLLDIHVFLLYAKPIWPSQLVLLLCFFRIQVVFAHQMFYLHITYLPFVCNENKTIFFFLKIKRKKQVSIAASNLHLNVI